MKLFTGLFVALGLFTAVPGHAQLPPVPPEAHQFDFWIGEWTVTMPDGKPAGTNRIEPIAGGRGLLENWVGAQGGGGKSLNAYNDDTQRWQQFWVGAGGILELSGGLDAQGRMVLAGHGETPDGSVIDRITWTPHADGTVRQHWEQSGDEGKTWKTLFDGLYTRVK